MKHASWIFCGALVIIAGLAISVDAPVEAPREVNGIVRGTALQPNDGPSTQAASVALDDGSTVVVEFDGRRPLRSGQKIKLREYRKTLGRKTYEVVFPVEYDVRVAK